MQFAIAFVFSFIKAVAMTLTIDAGGTIDAVVVAATAIAGAAIGIAEIVATGTVIGIAVSWHN